MSSPNLHIVKNHLLVVFFGKMAFKLPLPAGPLTPHFVELAEVFEPQPSPSWYIPIPAPFYGVDAITISGLIVGPGERGNPTRHRFWSSSILPSFEDVFLPRPINISHKNIIGASGTAMLMESQDHQELTAETYFGVVPGLFPWDGQFVTSNFRQRSTKQGIPSP
jgi:hypothetical protein